MRTERDMDLVAWAEEEAHRRLGPLGTRWLHARAVGRRANEVASAVDPDDRGLLVASGLLHDVGYAPELVVSGFYPLDGACWLRAQGQDRLAGLVAHHTAASFEAAALGLAEEVDEFADERSAVSDALS